MKFARKCNATTLYPENLKIPEKAYQKEKRILQPEMLKKLFSNDVTKDWYLNAFRFYTATGLRRGELIAIQTKRDLENGILYIRESVNKYQELTDGKNTNAKRVLKLNNIELNIIKDQLSLLKTNGIKSKYLFPNEKGERINPSTIYKKWVLFCEKNELEKISLHELRHTFISLCKEIPLELLKSRVGHSAQMDTFGQYGHAMEGEMEETSKLVEESFLKVIQ